MSSTIYHTALDYDSLHINDRKIAPASSQSQPKEASPRYLSRRLPEKPDQDQFIGMWQETNPFEITMYHRRIHIVENVKSFGNATDLYI